MHLPVPGAYFAGLPSGGNTSSMRVSRPKKYTKGEMITEMITSYNFLAVIIVFLNRCYNFFHFGVSVFYVVIFSFGFIFFFVLIFDVIILFSSDVIIFRCHNFCYLYWL